MPLQNPISCIISRSYWVRMRSRWASSSLPSVSNWASRSCSSVSMRPMAALHALLAGDVVGGREDDELVERARPSRR